MLTGEKIVSEPYRIENGVSRGDFSGVYMGNTTAETNILHRRHVEDPVVRSSLLLNNNERILLRSDHYI
jgi:hypothetical protein